jgi:hypothetical protein
MNMLGKRKARKMFDFNLNLTPPKKQNRKKVNLIALSTVGKKYPNL